MVSTSSKELIMGKMFKHGYQIVVQKLNTKVRKGGSWFCCIVRAGASAMLNIKSVKYRFRETPCFFVKDSKKSMYDACSKAIADPTLLCISGVVSWSLVMSSVV